MQVQSQKKETIQLHVRIVAVNVRMSLDQVKLTDTQQLGPFTYKFSEVHVYNYYFAKSFTL